MRINAYIGLFVVLLSTSCQRSSNKNYPQTITADKLLSIKLGMNKDTVKFILGEPIVENKETFEYTKRQYYHYPMIWIHFDSNAVREVYVKKYFFFDDQGIYGLSKNPVTGEIHQWGEEALRETIR